MKHSPYHGLLVVDKPGQRTSREMVDRALRWFPRGTRIGHTGTLDPLATGVLVLCVGAATRLAEYVQRLPKTYRAHIVLGGRSDTDDADGTVTPVAGAHPPDPAAVRASVAGLVGEQEQVPPAYSASWVGGRRAYDRARAGEAVDLAARRVVVHGIDLLAYDYPHLEIEVRCGKGTYIRSLARDLGERLGCGGYVAELRRLRVGPFDARDALDPSADAATARARLLPLTAALVEVPRLDLSADAVRRLRQGQPVPTDMSLPAGEWAAFAPDGALVGVVEHDPVSGRLRPVKIVAPARE